MGHVRLAEIDPVRAFPGVAHRLAVTRQLGATGIQLGDIVLEPGASIARHHHDVDDAMLVIAGHGVCRLGDEDVPLEPGTALVAPAGIVHGLTNTGSEPLRVVFAWPRGSGGTLLGRVAGQAGCTEGGENSPHRTPAFELPTENPAGSMRR